MYIFRKQLCCKGSPYTVLAVSECTAPKSVAGPSSWTQPHGSELVDPNSWTRSQEPFLYLSAQLRYR